MNELVHDMNIPGHIYIRVGVLYYNNTIAE